MEQHKKENGDANVHPHPVLSGNLGECEVVRHILCQHIENCLNA